MSAEMVELESRHGAVEFKGNMRGPSVGCLSGFLKKSGNMAGGDSPAYYWGYVLCEKLRIWEVSVFEAPTIYLHMLSGLRDMSCGSIIPDTGNADLEITHRAKRRQRQERWQR